MIPSLEDLIKVQDRIGKYIHHTPVLTNQSVDSIAGCKIHFKCENFQKVGAFKARGGVNAVLSLSDNERKKGITTHSSGNHAQAIAYAASILGCRAHIVMPENAPQVKIDAVKGYGAEITFCASTLAAREETVNRIVEETGAFFIHPYNDYSIIAGQASASLELINSLDSSLDAILAPVGGGGLLSGTSLAFGYKSPGTLIFGAEPEGADDARRSFLAGKLIPQVNPNTIADGLRTSLGEYTFEIIKNNVADILTTNDDEILAAMQLVWQRMKIIIEPSSAVPLAVVLRNRELFKGKNIGIILSGGNADLSLK